MPYLGISDEDWDNSSYQETLIAVTQFPIYSFCQSLFLHHIDYEKHFFLEHFFILLLEFVCFFLFQWSGMS